MNGPQGQSPIEALAISRVRISQLEREAIERKGDAEVGLRAHLDRYRALLLAIAHNNPDASQNLHKY